MYHSYNLYFPGTPRELSQHLENPGTAHWSAVERLLGYLYTDKNRRLLKMRTPNEMRPMDVVDSAFAINPDTRKSTSAYLGTIGASSLVTWTSKGQNIVTTSSTEAEYVSLSDRAKDTTFTTNLLHEIYYVDLPAVIAEDNTVAIFLSKNQQVGSRTKHIDVRYHFVREKVESGHVVVVYVQKRVLIPVTSFPRTLHRKCMMHTQVTFVMEQ